MKDSWTLDDVVSEGTKSIEEKNIAELNAKSQAALSYTLLNPDGSIWCLLSGGGASITIADEFYNLGYGQELGNYGEYSGNPNAEETYIYDIYYPSHVEKPCKTIDPTYRRRSCEFY